MGVQHSLYDVEEFTVDDVLDGDNFDVSLEFEKGLRGFRTSVRA